MQRNETIAHLANCFAPLIVLPAIYLGAFAMIFGGVSPVLWGQQLAASVLFTMLLFIPHSAVTRVPRKVQALLFLAALFAALLFPGAGGAKRWLDLGPLNVNAAMLVVPALLVLLCAMEHPLAALLLAAAALCLQPDLSQLAALLLGALPIVFRKREKPLLCAGVIALLLALCALCAMKPVSLEPVDYCEGALFMLGDFSPLLLAAGAAALVLIPLFFLLYFRASGFTAQLCLSAYYAAAILFGLSGQYPMTFMGFGISPIAGYFLALLLLRALHTDYEYDRLVSYANRMVKSHQHQSERSVRP